MKVHIGELKRNVASLPNNYTIRDPILAEPDEIEFDEFVVKAKVWLKVLSSDVKKTRSRDN